MRPWPGQVHPIVADPNRAPALHKPGHQLQSTCSPMVGVGSCALYPRTPARHLTPVPQGWTAGPRGRRKMACLPAGTAGCPRTNAFTHTRSTGHPYTELHRGGGWTTKEDKGSQRKELARAHGEPSIQWHAPQSRCRPGLENEGRLAKCWEQPLTGPTACATRTHQQHRKHNYLHEAAAAAALPALHPEVVLAMCGRSRTNLSLSCLTSSLHLKVQMGDSML
jgi:hypothetical protein